MWVVLLIALREFFVSVEPSGGVLCRMSLGMSPGGVLVCVSSMFASSVLWGCPLAAFSVISYEMSSNMTFAVVPWGCPQCSPLLWGPPELSSRVSLGWFSEGHLPPFYFLYIYFNFLLLQNTWLTWQAWPWRFGCMYPTAKYFCISERRKKSFTILCYSPEIRRSDY